MFIIYSLENMAYKPLSNHSGLEGGYNLQKLKHITNKKMVNIYSYIHQK